MDEYLFMLFWGAHPRVSVSPLTSTSQRSRPSRCRLISIVRLRHCEVAPRWRRPQMDGAFPPLPWNICKCLINFEWITVRLSGFRGLWSSRRGPNVKEKDQYLASRMWRLGGKGRKRTKVISPCSKDFFEKENYFTFEDQNKCMLRTFLKFRNPAFPLLVLKNKTIWLNNNF